MAAVRGALMEQLARCLPSQDEQHLGEKAFMVGILSLLEVIYRISMEEVVASVALSEDVRDALVSRAGDLGALLEATEMIERLEFAPALERLGITRDDLRLAQVKAYSWREGMHP
jgi:EAL and modified HD-GYP domain-containing signal transduction protein